MNVKTADLAQARAQASLRIASDCRRMMRAEALCWRRSLRPSNQARLIAQAKVMLHAAQAMEAQARRYLDQALIATQPGGRDLAEILFGPRTTL